MVKIDIDKNESEKYSLNKEDLSKVGKGFLLASTGAIVDLGAKALLSVDFGSFTPLIYTLVPVVVNVFRKLLSGK